MAAMGRNRAGHRLALAFRFALKETPQAGLRRIACEQATKILARLAAEGEHETTVHESRKALKRLKALLKLVRGGLAKQTYEREYGVVRDVARSLSGARDLEVMPLTLAALGAGGARREAVDQVLAAIERGRAKGTIGAGQRDEFASAISELEAARARYAKLRLRENSFTVLEQGTARGLRTLRQQFDRAVASGEDEDYHDWRKSAQLHWRHLRLLSENWPAMMAARITATKSLAAVLGHDHDLAVLANFLKTVQTSNLKAGRRKALLGDIRERQLGLRAEARAWAGLLVIDTPARFAANLRAYRAARIEFDQLQTPHCDLFG